MHDVNDSFIIYNIHHLQGCCKVTIIAKLYSNMVYFQWSPVRKLRGVVRRTSADFKKNY